MVIESSVALIPIVCLIDSMSSHVQVVINSDIIILIVHHLPAVDIAVPKSILLNSVLFAKKKIKASTNVLTVVMQKSHIRVIQVTGLSVQHMLSFRAK